MENLKWIFRVLRCDMVTDGKFYIVYGCYMEFFPYSNTVMSNNFFSEESDINYEFITEYSGTSKN